jgi:hypothetical protein
MVSAWSRIVRATPGSMFVTTPVVASPACFARYMTVAEVPRYGIAPRRPNVSTGFGTVLAMEDVTPNYRRMSHVCRTRRNTTYERILWLCSDGICGHVPTRDDLCCICSRITDFFSNIKGCMSKRLGGWTARDRRRDGSVRLVD